MTRYWLWLRVFIVATAFGVGLIASFAGVEKINSQLMVFSWKTLSNLLIMGGFLAVFATVGWMIMALIVWAVTSRSRTWRRPNWTENPFNSPIQIAYITGVASLASGVGTYIHVWALNDKYAIAWFLAGITVSVGLGSILAAFLAATIFGFSRRAE